jgi:hypothetical protein
MLRQSCYNNNGSERVFLCGKMSQNVVRGGEKSKAGEKGDGRCYCPSWMRMGKMLVFMMNLY